MFRMTRRSAMPSRVRSAAPLDLESCGSVGLVLRGTHGHRGRQGTRSASRQPPLRVASGVSPVSQPTVAQAHFRGRRSDALDGCHGHHLGTFPGLARVARRAAAVGSSGPLGSHYCGCGVQCRTQSPARSCGTGHSFNGHSAQQTPRSTLAQGTLSPSHETPLLLSGLPSAVAGREPHLSSPAALGFGPADAPLANSPARMSVASSTTT